MTLQPLPPVDDFIPTSGRWTTALAIKAMHEYAEAYARAAIAAHVPEAGCGNIAAVPAQPVAWLGGDGHPHHISAVQTITERRIYGPWQPLYAAPQAVPVPAELPGFDLQEHEVEEWADGFILKKAYNRPVAIQIATEAAKWALARAEQRFAALPVPVALTPDQAMRLWHADKEAHKRISAFEWYAAGILAAESEHGIPPRAMLAAAPKEQPHE